MKEPAPGWGRNDDLNFISPSTASKLAATCSGDGRIHIFYQAQDMSIRELVSGTDKSWDSWEGDEKQVVAPGKAKAATPLASVSGAWAETRLFYVTPNNTLALCYSDDQTGWVESTYPSTAHCPIALLPTHSNTQNTPANCWAENKPNTDKLPLYTLLPSAMLAAVALNHATAFFEMRVYTADDKDDVTEFSFSRSSGGWSETCRSVSRNPPEPLAPTGTPLSAIAAVLTENEWRTKIYFHPRRPAIAEWDLCAEATEYPGIAKVSRAGRARRQMEQETRKRIEEERERERREEEMKKEEERLRREEEERQRQAEAAATGVPTEKMNEFKNAKKGDAINVQQFPKLAEKMQARSGCAAGFAWHKTEGGWRCAGGMHKISDDDFNAL